MLFCTKTLFAAGVRGANLVPQLSAPFLRTSLRAMGHGSHTGDNNPEILAKEKQRNLQGKVPEAVPGAPGWNPGLASESEAVVKAERCPSMDFEDLQRHTIETLDRMEATHPDAATSGHPEPHTGPVEGSHEPSDAPSIKENLEYDKTRKGEMPQ